MGWKVGFSALLGLVTAAGKDLTFGSCKFGSWGGWYNQDQPSGAADSEMIKDRKDRDGLCDYVALQARNSKTKATTTTEDVRLNDDGFKCMNGEQKDGKCEDYEIRLCCPTKAPTVTVPSITVTVAPITVPAVTLPAVTKPVPETWSRCVCWGDPHCTTFDGTSNDVYGVATYIMAQSKPNVFPAFRVRLETEKWRKVSVSRKTTLDLFDSDGKLAWSIITDRFGKSFYQKAGGEKKHLCDNVKVPGWTFTKGCGRMTTVTDFGLEVIQQGKQVTVRAPNSKFFGNTEGICGDNNGDMTNDFTTSTGVTLPYKTGKRYERSDSEFTCAQSWIYKADSPRPVEGPKPAEVECNNMIAVNKCEKLFNAQWLVDAGCDRIVSAGNKTTLIENCKVDYCADTTKKTLTEIMGQYVSECQRGSIGPPILCDWEAQLHGKVPTCSATQVYNGCANSCLMKTCDDDKSSCIPDFQEPFSACVCKEGHVIRNNMCVKADTCGIQGWSTWDEWTECSVKTGKGTRSRTKTCYGKSCTKPSETATVPCDNGPPEAECPGHSDVSLHDGTCDTNLGYSWTSWKNQGHGDSGDDELRENWGLDAVCDGAPTGIQGQIGGLMCSSQKVHFGLEYGLSCENIEQRFGAKCGNYQTRYCCKSKRKPTKCMCWGDPHCMTFDGLRGRGADVQGSGTFLFSRPKSADRRWAVRFESTKWGWAASITKIYVDFFTSGKLEWSVLMDNRQHVRKLDYASGTNTCLKENDTGGGHFKYYKAGNWNWLEFHGVKLKYWGRDMHVWVPNGGHYGYFDGLQGTCGNNNGNSRDDNSIDIRGNTGSWGHVQGTYKVGERSRWNIFDHRFTTAYNNQLGASGAPSPPKNPPPKPKPAPKPKRKPCFFFCWFGRRRRRQADDDASQFLPGEPATENAKCANEEIIAECDALYDADWMAECKTLVGAEDRKRLIDDCKMDYCVDHTQKTKKGLIKIFVDECNAKAPADKKVMCDWEAHVDGNAPDCGENAKYTGCANSCSQTFCDNPTKTCLSDGDTISGCFCTEGHALLNNKCVPLNECSATGWAPWNDWTECSGEGVKSRARFCMSEGCEGDDQEEETCELPPPEGQDAAQNMKMVPIECLSDCWEFDEKTGKCKPKTDDKCFKLTCEHDEIQLDFSSTLFALKDNEDAPFADDSDTTPKWDAGRWRVNCKLGECGMDIFTLEGPEKTELSFMFDVRVNRPFDAKIEDMEIFMQKERIIEIVFECRYAQEVKVTTDVFDVNAIDAKDTAVAHGSLDKGFKLHLFTDDTLTASVNDETNYIGSMIWARVQWEVKNLTDKLSFYIDRVDVSVGTNSMAIVKDNCYSDIFSARPISEKVQSTEAVMKFKSFIVGSEARKMTFKVVASIKVCAVEGDKCKVNLSTKNEDCDNTVAAYKYLP